MSTHKKNPSTYRFCFLWLCPRPCTEFVSRALFELMFLLLLLLFLMIWFSLLLFLRLLFCWIFVAASNRSFSESPMTRKFGKRIQQVFTEQDPDIPWHLHSSRISACTCCTKKIKKREFVINSMALVSRFYSNKIRDSKEKCFKFVKLNWQELIWSLTSLQKKLQHDSMTSLSTEWKWIQSTR